MHQEGKEVMEGGDTRSTVGAPALRRDIDGGEFDRGGVRGDACLVEGRWEIRRRYVSRLETMEGGGGAKEVGSRGVGVVCEVAGCDCDSRSPLWAYWACRVVREVGKVSQVASVYRL